jgi:halogenation protein CepH
VAVTGDCDVVVVGGGPAGAAVASLVARRGHRVVLLEAEFFPRYQIGESLLPATVHGVCRLLGVVDELEAAGFPRKRGGSFRWGSNPAPWTFAFELAPELSVPTGYAYQVRRMEFDQILLENARRCGVEVREGCPVREVLGDGGRVCGVAHEDPSGRRREVRARWVVDASGNRSRLHGRVGERRPSENFQNLAVFGYFAGGRRLPGANAGNILCAAFDEGWLWYIPLRADLTSVGAVVGRDQAGRIAADPAAALAAFVERCDIVREYLAGVERVRDGVYGQTRVRKDYSYTTDRFWRPGMVVVGDAACFVDPVFSTGVHLATYGALLATRSLNSVLAGEVDEERAFGEFEGRYRREYRMIYEFLTAFYDMHRDEGSYFWNAHQVLGDGHTNLESFVTLVGGVASGERALTGATGPAVPGDEDELVDYRFGAPGMPAALHEMVDTTRRAVTGQAPVNETPLLPGGLVPSADMLSWTDPAVLAPAR